MVMRYTFIYGNLIIRRILSDTGNMERSAFSSCSKYNPDTVILVLSVKERTLFPTWRIAFDTISFRTFVILLCLYYVSC